MRVSSSKSEVTLLNWKTNYSAASSRRGLGQAREGVKASQGLVPGQWSQGTGGLVQNQQ